LQRDYATAVVKTSQAARDAARREGMDRIARGASVLPPSSTPSSSR